MQRQGDARESGQRPAAGSERIYRVKDGKVVETWAMQDRLGLLQQLGAVAAGQEVTWAGGHLGRRSPGPEVTWAGGGPPRPKAEATAAPGDV